LRFVVALLLIPLVLAIVCEAAISFYYGFGLVLRSWVTYGFLVYVPIYLLLYGQNIRFLEILEHESLHAAAAIFSGRRVEWLVAEPHVGETFALPPMSGCLVLVPYCLPLLFLPLLVLSALTSPPVKHGIDFATGLVLGFHIVALVRFELRFWQPDIKGVGLLFSFCVITAANALLLVLILGIASGEFEILVDYFYDTYERTIEFYVAAGEMGSALIEWLDDVIGQLW
jgi:hypothetical protein